MWRMFAITASPTCARGFVMACVVFAALSLSVRPACAQGRDGLLNGTVIGAVVGAGVGVAFTHAVRDSDLTFGQYAYGAILFGAIGAGAGLGVDALFNRASPRPGESPQRVLIAPGVWRDVKGVVVKWRW